MEKNSVSLPPKSEENPYGGLCDVYSCHKDCGSCCLVTWAPCTCCITYCIFRQKLGSLISPHASEVASSCNQIKNCCSYLAPQALRNIPVVGGAVALASECLNLAICPLQNQYNLDLHLMELAQARLGYQHYPPPLGLRNSPGAQLYHPCLGCCTECLVYRHLKGMLSIQAVGAPDPEPAVNPNDTGACCSNAEWSNPFCIFDDCYVCAMMSVLNCLTCGITGCVGRCKIGEMIGTEEAKELTSCKGQCVNCLTYCPCGLCACFCCPENTWCNFDDRVLMMAKEKLGRSSFPKPSGLPHTPGFQMANYCTAPCTWCLIWKDLRLQAAGSAAPFQDIEQGNSKSASVEMAAPGKQA